MIQAKSFTAVGSSEWFPVKFGDKIYYSVSGTFTATYKIEKTQSPGTGLSTVASGSEAATGILLSEAPDRGVVYYRFTCSAFTDGTMVTGFVDKDVPSVDLSKRIQFTASGLAKAGTTAGFVVAAGNNLALVTCPHEITAGTLVLPLPGLKVGSKITSFNLVGQIESAGGAVTLDASLRKQTAAAADVADALVASMDQLSVVADTIVSASNAAKVGLDEIVAEDAIYYLLITATTATTTDIALQGAVLTVIE